MTMPPIEYTVQAENGEMHRNVVEQRVSTATFQQQQQHAKTNPPIRYRA